MRLVSMAWLAALVCCVVSTVRAEDIGQIKNVTGEVTVSRTGETLQAIVGLNLKQHDTIVTGDGAEVGMTFIDNTRFSAGPNTRLRLSTFRFNPTTHQGQFISKVERGTLAVSSGQIAKGGKEQMEIHTPTSILGVRGTFFLVEVLR